MDFFVRVPLWTFFKKSLLLLKLLLLLFQFIEWTRVTPESKFQANIFIYSEKKKYINLDFYNNFGFYCMDTPFEFFLKKLITS